MRTTRRTGEIAGDGVLLVSSFSSTSNIGVPERRNMPGKKTNKQRKREAKENKRKLKKLSVVDMIQVGKSTDRGRKW